MSRRRAFDRAFRLAAAGCALAACAVMAGLVAAVFTRGLPALDLGLLRAGGGGIAYQIAGTCLLVATALAVAVPLATGTALARSVYVRSPAARRRVDLGLYTLNGVPSILFGIFGLVVLVRGLGWGKSWLAGGIVLGWMILPTLTVTVVERMEAIPRKYLDAAAGLGLSRSQIARSVVLPQSAGGLASGVLLGLARAAGETAPIMFTAAVFSGATLPRGIAENPVLALPYHVFVLAQDSFDPAAGAEMWGAALVLIALVLVASLVALPARIRLHEEARRG